MQCEILFSQKPEWWNSTVLSAHVYIHVERSYGEDLVEQGECCFAMTRVDRATSEEIMLMVSKQWMVTDLFDRC